jgi:hypothetical protein
MWQQLQTVRPVSCSCRQLILLHEVSDCQACCLQLHSATPVACSCGQPGPGTASLLHELTNSQICCMQLHTVPPVAFSCKQPGPEAARPVACSYIRPRLHAAVDSLTRIQSGLLHAIADSKAVKCSYYIQLGLLHAVTYRQACCLDGKVAAKLHVPLATTVQELNCRPPRNARIMVPA